MSNKDEEYSRGRFMQSVFRVGLVAAIALVFLLVPRVASAHAVVVPSRRRAVNETVQGPDVAVT